MKPETRVILVPGNDRSANPHNCPLDRANDVDVPIGILVNNARLSDVRSSMSDVQTRLTNLEAKFDSASIFC